MWGESWGGVGLEGERWGKGERWGRVRGRGGVGVEAER